MPEETYPPQAPHVFLNGWVPREDVTPDRPCWYETECCTRWPRMNEVAINCLCGHRVHEGCLTSLLRAYRHDGCPVCVNATFACIRQGMYYTLHVSNIDCAKFKSLQLTASVINGDESKCLCPTVRQAYLCVLNMGIVLSRYSPGSQETISSHGRAGAGASRCKANTAAVYR